MIPVWLQGHADEAGALIEHGFDWSSFLILAPFLILFAPLLASLATFLWGKTMWRGGAAIPLVGVGISVIASLYLFWVFIVDGHGVVDAQVTWFTAGEYTFKFGFLLDNLSVWLAAIVSILSFLITLFSTHYLHEEPDAKLRRYYAVKALFIGGMLGTVLMDNFLMMFIFWEVMGLCSYLLIGYWYHKDSAATAAKKAFLTTRLGDILLMVGILLLLVAFHTLSYREIFNHPELMARKTTVFWASLLIFGGAVGKSAQFPLDIWLPDAMEGPTTVSALIHAATMVKAGVFLVARSFPLFVVNPDTFIIIGVIGGFTALYTATMALTALDIKRVLAFSTLSQLGYMFLALGAGGVVFTQGDGNGIGFTAAMLHLQNHAFFKALLFLGAASVILGMHHHQDMREMGGLRHKMPKTYWTMMVATLAIAGIIPFSGFWSKDEVLATAFKAGSYNASFTLLWVMGVITALLTAFYMFRLMFLTFHGTARTQHAEDAHESPGVMTGPLIVLAVFAALAGLWLITPFAGGFESVITYPYSDDLGHPRHAPPSEILMGILTEPKTYLSLGVAVLGIVWAWRRYGKGLPQAEEAEPSRGWRKLTYKRYYVTEAVYQPLGNIVGVGVAKLSALFDSKGIDGAVNGIARGADTAGAQTRRWQDGHITTYLASIAVGAAVLLAGMLLLLPYVRWW